jgi:hypothetical protein
MKVELIYLIIICIIIYNLYSNYKIEKMGDTTYLDSSLNVNGDINTSGAILQKRNKARYIKVGNKDDVLAQDYWTLIELRAYDRAGNNVALGKPVTIKEGTTYGGTPPGNITNNKIFTNPKANPNARQDNWNLGYHGNPGTNLLQIDLGEEIDLSQIVLFNRWNPSIFFRMDGTTVELIGADNKSNRIIYTGLWDKDFTKSIFL